MADSVTPSCGMCFKIYDITNHLPKVLRCGHTYCAMCLEGWKQGDRICPEGCEKSTRDPIEELPTNFDHLRSIDAMCGDCSLQPPVVSTKSAEAGLVRQPPVIRPDYSKATFAREVGKKGSGPGKFKTPWGITCLPSGNVVVTEESNHRVQFLDQNLQYVSSYGRKGSEGGQFQFPTGVAVDSRGLVFVADYNNHRLQITDQTGRVQYTCGSKGLGPGKFNKPHGIAIDKADQVYVADLGNSRIQVLRSDGSYIRTLTTVGTGPGQLADKPVCVSVTNTGQVVVTDVGGNLYTYDSLGPHINTRVKGQPGSFKNATGTVSDRWGNLLVADFEGGCVVVLSESGNVICKIGTKGSRPGQLKGPFGLTLSEEGDVLVCDGRSDKVVKYAVPKIS